MRVDVKISLSDTEPNTERGKKADIEYTYEVSPDELALILPVQERLFGTVLDKLPVLFKELCKDA